MHVCLTPVFTVLDIVHGERYMWNSCAKVVSFRGCHNAWSFHRVSRCTLLNCDINKIQEQGCLPFHALLSMFLPWAMCIHDLFYGSPPVWSYLAAYPLIFESYQSMHQSRSILFFAYFKALQYNFPSRLNISCIYVLETLSYISHPCFDLFLLLRFCQKIEPVL